MGGGRGGGLAEDAGVRCGVGGGFVDGGGTVESVEVSFDGFADNVDDVLVFDGWREAEMINAGGEE